MTTVTAQPAPHKADRWAVVIIATHAVLWLAGQLPHRSYEFDVYEMIVMGQEWQASYWKHPPLPPWLAEIAFEVFGRSNLGPALLSVTCVAIALLLIWRMSRDIFGPAGGLVALILSLGTYYVMLPMTQFNHNLAQLPFWAAVLVLYRGAVLRDGLWRWLLLGVVTWGLMATKYTGALLLVAIGIHALATPEGRRALRSYGPWLALAVALAMSVPQILYLVNVDASSLRYGFDRPEALGLDRLLAPIVLLAIQLLFIVPALLMIGAERVGPRLADVRKTVAPSPPTVFDRRLLLLTFLIPLAFAAMSVLIAGRWGRPEALGSMFIALGPTLMALRVPVRPIRLTRIAVLAAAFVILVPPIVSGFTAHIRYWITGEIPAQGVSYRATADQIAAEWQVSTGSPLTIIAASFMDGGRIALELEPQPSVMIDGRFDHSPWVTPERIATEGLLVVWQRPADEPCGAPPDDLTEHLNRPAMVDRDPVVVDETGERFCRAALLPSSP